MNGTLNRQQGITTIGYLAIALLIAALIFSGLYVQRRLFEGRVNESAELLNSIASAFTSYQETYGQLPGDDGPLPLLTARGDEWIPVQVGDADGILEAPDYRTFTGVDESGAIWQHLRAAALIGGDPAVGGEDALPSNLWGGRVGVMSTEMGGGLTGHKLCLSRVPGAEAEAIDARLDDGAGDSGRLRGTLANPDEDTAPDNTALAIPYARDGLYTLCYSFQLTD